MNARLAISGGTALALIALAFGIALGQPSPKQPADPGLFAAEAVATVINCPPTRPEASVSDC